MEAGAPEQKWWFERACLRERASERARERERERERAALLSTTLCLRLCHDHTVGSLRGVVQGGLHVGSLSQRPL